MAVLGHNGGPPIVESDAIRMHFTKFNFQDFMSGVRGMKADEIGIYTLLIAAQYVRMSRLPDDDSWIALHIGVDIRIWKRIKKKLIGLGKIFCDGESIWNSRTEREITTFCAGQKARRDTATEREAKKRLSAEIDEIDDDKDGSYPAAKPQLSRSYRVAKPQLSRSYPLTNDDLSKKPNENNGIETGLGPTRARSRSNIEDIEREEERIKQKNDLAEREKNKAEMAAALAPALDGQDVSRDDASGELKLHNGVRLFWLEQFDEDERELTLGLKQAANYVQPNSYKPLQAQVEAQLAKQVRDRMDQDKRYAKAAKVNSERVRPGTGGGRGRPTQGLDEALAAARAKKQQEQAT